jgi:hypothetical protein
MITTSLSKIPTNGNNNPADDKLLKTLEELTSVLKAEAKSTYTYVYNVRAVVMATSNDGRIKTIEEGNRLIRAGFLEAAPALNNSIATMKKGLKTLKDDESKYSSIRQFCSTYQSIISEFEKCYAIMQNSVNPSDLNVPLSNISRHIKNLQ